MNQQKKKDTNILCFFFWIFEKEGNHTVKIIFRKKLFKCDYMFYVCDRIIELDCSNFDCSQITDCQGMFFNCSSLKKINLKNIEFPLSENFSCMFSKCEQLKEFDVSLFKTHNSLSFSHMFNNCCKLKKIDVSKFVSLKCKDINYMFQNCSELSEIDMLNWDMSNIDKNMNYVFNGCKNLNNMKMSANNKFLDGDINTKSYIFDGLPEEGKFIWKKGNKCKNLLNLLPSNWDMIQKEND